MPRPLTILLVIWSLGVWAVPWPHATLLAAAPPVRSNPPQVPPAHLRIPIGNLSKGHLRACFYQGSEEIRLASCHLPGKQEGKLTLAPFPRVSFQNCQYYEYPFRSKYGFGHLWLTSANVHISPGIAPIFNLFRLPEAEVAPQASADGAGSLPLLERAVKKDPFALYHYSIGPDGERLSDALEDLRLPPDGTQKLLPSPIQWDIVPTGRTTALLIILSPVKEHIAIHELSFDPPKKQKGRPMPIETLEGRPKPAETLSMPFGGGFRVFERREGLYFVTESGKVFLARKTRKGRVWETVWDDPTQPVSAILVDEDRDGKVFLAGHAPTAIPWVYRPFVLALEAKPKVHLFYPWDIKRVQTAPPLRELAQFAQLVGKVK